jgi:hypothetical protein
MLGIGERIRLGCSSRRLADWAGRAQAEPKGVVRGRTSVFGGTPNTARETRALPRIN